MTPSAATSVELLTPLREVIGRYGLWARKSLGQHFLLDRNLTDRIARVAGDLRFGTTIEIGPGPGGLTRSLLGAGASLVIAVEKDGRCVSALTELLPVFGPRLVIVEADALEVDLTALGPPPRRVVANLPYNVGTPLLIQWLRSIQEFESLTLMFQKEVADRLTATPGSKAYGRLSVMVRWLCEVNLEFIVDSRAFTPRPSVASAVIRLCPRQKPLAPATWEALETVTRAAFGQRRKMLRGSLNALSLDLGSTGVDPRKRADDVTVEEFCTLARAYAQQRQNDERCHRASSAVESSAAHLGDECG